MTLNLESLNLENDVSLEELPIESLIQTDVEPDKSFTNLFEDHLALLIEQNEQKLTKVAPVLQDTGPYLLDLDVQCIDELNDSTIFNLEEVNEQTIENSDDYETLDPIHEQQQEEEEEDGKPQKTFRRQSMRIQNQIRKQIADQIQRENNRIEKEAQLLSGNKPKSTRKPAQSTSSKICDDHNVDLDDEEEEHFEEPDITDIDEDDDPNKLWCICKQPYDYRFMICCDMCLDWFHGDCVGVSQEEGTIMEATGEEFTCPGCASSLKLKKQQLQKTNELKKHSQEDFAVSSSTVTKDDSDNKCSEKTKGKRCRSTDIASSVIISDDEDDEGIERQLTIVTNNNDPHEDDECLFVKQEYIPSSANRREDVVTSKLNSNIFQLLENGGNVVQERNKLTKNSKQLEIQDLSSRTSVCLNPGCKTLVNPRKSQYCSKFCIKKYSRIVVAANRKDKIAQYGLLKGLRLAKMTRFVLAQLETETIQDEIAAPTEENLRDFLLKNPSFKVFQSHKRTNNQRLTSGSIGTVASGATSSNNRKPTDILIKTDAAKRVKVVKNFALLIKKLFMQGKTLDQAEFRNIWQRCVELEEAIYKISNQHLNEIYMNRVKELLNLFKQNLTSGCSDILDSANNGIVVNFLRGKLSPIYLATTSVSKMDANYRDNMLKGEVGGTEGGGEINSSSGINNSNNYMANAAGASNSTTIISACVSSSTGTGFGGGSDNNFSLLCDTTHLHGQHFYDINCNICNGGNKQKKEKESKTVIDITDQSPTVSPNNNHNSQNHNDEDKVTTSVRTPDMAMDMEISDGEDQQNNRQTSAGTNKKSSSVRATANCNDANSCGGDESVMLTGSDNKLLSMSSATAATAATATPTSNNSTNSGSASRSKLTTLWVGDIIYKDIGKVECKAFLVSRLLLGNGELSVNQHRFTSKDDAEFLKSIINLSSNVDNQVIINGRVKMVVVEDYLKKLKKHSNKEFVIMRLHPSNLETGRKSYQELFQDLHSRNRCGVMNQRKCGLKDCYIFPLNAHAKVPQYLLPFNGPGLERKRPHLLLLIVVRTPIQAFNHKPISPKFDEAHDREDKHGVNLEKYSHPDIILGGPVQKKTDSVKSQQELEIVDDLSKAVESEKCKDDKHESEIKQPETQNVDKTNTPSLEIKLVEQDVVVTEPRDEEVTKGNKTVDEDNDNNNNNNTEPVVTVIRTEDIPMPQFNLDDIPMPSQETTPAKTLDENKTKKNEKQKNKQSNTKNDDKKQNRKNKEEQSKSSRKRANSRERDREKNDLSKKSDKSRLSPKRQRKRSISPSSRSLSSSSSQSSRTNSNRHFRNRQNQSKYDRSRKYRRVHHYSSRRDRNGASRSRSISQHFSKSNSNDDSSDTEPRTTLVNYSDTVVTNDITGSDGGAVGKKYSVYSPPSSSSTKTYLCSTIDNVIDYASAVNQEINCLEINKNENINADHSEVVDYDVRSIVNFNQDIDLRAAAAIIPCTVDNVFIKEKSVDISGTQCSTEMSEGVIDAPEELNLRRYTFYNPLESNKSDYFYNPRTNPCDWPQNNIIDCDSYYWNDPYTNSQLETSSSFSSSLLTNYDNIATTSNILPPPLPQHSANEMSSHSNYTLFCPSQTTVKDIDHRNRIMYSGTDVDANPRPVEIYDYNQHYDYLP